MIWVMYSPTVQIQRPQHYKLYVPCFEHMIIMQHIFWENKIWWPESFFLTWTCYISTCIKDIKMWHAQFFQDRNNQLVKHEISTSQAQRVLIKSCELHLNSQSTLKTMLWRWITNIATNLCIDNSFRFLHGILT